MRAVRQRPAGSARGDMLILVVLCILAVLAGMVLAAYHLGGGDDPTWNPLQLALDLGKSKATWPTGATVVLIVLVLILAGVVIGGAAVAGKIAGRHGPRREVDRAAKTMTKVSKVEVLSEKWSRGQSARLTKGLDPDHPAYRGILMGHTVSGNRPVHVPWEWVVVVIAGARMGKTAAVAVPAVCSAPGACVATSNKPDIYTHTRYTRERIGKIWLFDLQGVTTGDGGGASFFWNPLRQIHDLPSAKKVASYFVGASKEDGARVDAYFDGSAQDLLATYMLAAALAGGDLVHAVEWMANDQSTVPAAILTSHGEHAVARMLTAKQSVTERQRDGFYDMARRFLETLDAQRYARAILPNQRITIEVGEAGEIVTKAGEKVHDLPEFRAADFATSADTLYALSKEGPDSAAALTTAIIGQVLDCASEAGARTGSGRLDVPMVAVLDEAANVCRLQELPNQYSHFGSRGIIPITILQSPSQGKNVWGPGKFQTMLDACNMVWYGGNVTDKELLASFSELIGDHHVETESSSRSGGQGGMSHSRSWQRERILTPDDLAALPGDRAIIQLAASKPLLVRKAFASSGPYAEDIARSRELYEGGAPAPAPAPILEDEAEEHAEDGELAQMLADPDLFDTAETK